MTHPIDVAAIRREITRTACAERRQQLLTTLVGVLTERLR